MNKTKKVCILSIFSKSKLLLSGKKRELFTRHLFGNRGKTNFGESIYDARLIEIIEKAGIIPLNLRFI